MWKWRGVKRDEQKNRGTWPRLVKRGAKALLLRGLGGFLGEEGRSLLTLQVGDATLLLDDFVVLLAHGFVRF